MNLSEEDQIDLVDWIKDVLRKKVKEDRSTSVNTIISDFKKGDVENMTYGIERIFDEERAKGEVKGKAEGKAEVINLIKKKMNKGLSSFEIADILELEEGYVGEVIDLIKGSPGLSDKEIALKLIQQQNQTFV